MTTSIDMAVLGTIVGTLTALAIPMAFVVKGYYKITSTLKENTKAIVSSKKERRVLLMGVLACLNGLREHGCNGPVVDGIKAIDKYMVDELHDLEEGEN